jgi:uncharacterized membrane protein YfcA
MALAIASGVLVGLITGLTGAGGGILAVPLLVFGLQMTVAEAGLIGLLAVSVLPSWALIGLKSKLGRYRTALPVAAMGVRQCPHCYR